VEVNICRFLWFFVYICISVGYPIIKRGDIWHPYNRFKPPHVCSPPKLGPGFPKGERWLFIFFGTLKSDSTHHFF
jgi:hypothetical protein